MTAADKEYLTWTPFYRKMKEKFWDFSLFLSNFIQLMSI